MDGENGAAVRPAANDEDLILPATAAAAPAGPVAETAVGRLTHWLAGLVRPAYRLMTPLEARLDREVSALRREVEERDRRIMSLRYAVDEKEMQNKVLERQVELQASVIAREQARVKAETAVAAMKVAELSNMLKATEE